MLPFEDVVMTLIGYGFSYTEIVNMNIQRLKIYLKKVLVLQEEQERQLREAQNL